MAQGAFNPGGLVAPVVVAEGDGEAGGGPAGELGGGVVGEVGDDAVDGLLRAVPRLVEDVGGDAGGDGDREG
jgi:hypothetical protein